MPILNVKNLSITFDNRSVVYNLSFSLEKGECLAIIGPNGSGKTVLLKALLGVIPYEGEIDWAPGVKLGYVPQKIDADRHLPLNLQNLLTAKTRLLRLPKSEIKTLSKNIELQPDILNSPIGHLSGGQFQKALIAFALLGNPNVILFDEPTASLDQLTEEHIYELMRDLQEKLGITIFLVSHDLSIVYRYATKVLCLNRKAICLGTPQEALQPQILEKLYASPPKYHHHE
jgi:zinc transport system ATP-binding protein